MNIGIVEVVIFFGLWYFIGFWFTLGLCVLGVVAWWAYVLYMASKKD